MKEIIMKNKPEGTYIVITKNTIEYLKALQQRRTEIVKFGKTPEEIFAKNSKLCDMMFLINRKYWDKNQKSIVNTSGKFLIPDGIIKTCYQESEARENYPEYFI